MSEPAVGIQAHDSYKLGLRPADLGVYNDYLVLVDDTIGYTHIACGKHTTISKRVAATYANNPLLLDTIFCIGCGNHFPAIDGNGSPTFIFDQK